MSLPEKFMKRWDGQGDLPEPGEACVIQCCLQRGPSGEYPGIFEWTNGDVFVFTSFEDNGQVKIHELKNWLFFPLLTEDEKIRKALKDIVCEVVEELGVEEVYASLIAKALYEKGVLPPIVD